MLRFVVYSDPTIDIRGIIICTSFMKLSCLVTSFVHAYLSLCTSCFFTVYSLESCQSVIQSFVLSICMYVPVHFLIKYLYLSDSAS